MMMKWEDLGRGPLTSTQPTRLFRCKVPGGWLVAICGHQEAALTFMPDAEGAWQLQQEHKLGH